MNALPPVSKASKQTNPNNLLENKKALDFSKALSGMDGTRTRDLLRDRQAF